MISVLCTTSAWNETVEGNSSELLIYNVASGIVSISSSHILPQKVAKKKLSEFRN